MVFEQQIEACLQARCPLIVLATVEEERAVERLTALCARTDRRCLCWSPADGFRRLCGGEGPLPAASDPPTALEHIERWLEPAVILLPDLHGCRCDPHLRRKLKSVAQRMRHTGGTVVLVTPTGDVAPDLDDLAVQLAMPLPEAEELGVALDTCLTSAARTLQDGERTRVLQAVAGLTLRQAGSVFARATAMDGAVGPAVTSLVLSEVARRIRPDDAVRLCPARVGAEDVAGLEALKQWALQRRGAYSQQAVDYGLPPPRGVALVGIPGTGKSLAAGMLAGILDLPLLRLDTAILFGGPPGEEEMRLQRALDLACVAAPCVLWLDELDAAVANGILDGGAGARVFGVIRRWARDQRAGAFIVATANDTAWLPPDLLHRRWLDEVFLLDLPDSRERAQILAVHLRRAGRDPARYDLHGPARQMDGFVGAEIARVVREALYAAFAEGGREVGDGDIARAAARQAPVSQVLQDTIDTLREWCDAGRLTPASLRRPEDAGQTETPLQVDFRHRREE